MQKKCRKCGEPFNQFTTLQNLCGKCQYNKMMDINLKSQAKAKPISRMGKKATAWIIERKRWIRDHPADVWGYWYCYLRTTTLCPVRLRDDNPVWEADEIVIYGKLTLDHVIPRSKQQKTELAPACEFCNSDKGSQTLEDYLELHPVLKGLPDYSVNSG